MNTLVLGKKSYVVIPKKEYENFVTKAVSLIQVKSER